jgi:hypothetical protein
MKKIAKILFVAMLLGAFTECKKGEDDPFISFRSRKARAAGEWTLTSGTMTSLSRYNTSSSSSTVTYDETVYSVQGSYTSGGSTSSYSDSGTHSYKLTLEKDGTYRLEEIYDGDVEISEGTWNFSGKVGDRKNKEQLLLTRTSYIAGSTSNVYKGNETYATFDIKELRNKKMVLINEFSYVDPDGDTDDTKTELVLEQK